MATIIKDISAIESRIENIWSITSRLVIDTLLAAVLTILSFVTLNITAGLPVKRFWLMLPLSPIFAFIIDRIFNKEAKKSRKF